MNIGETYIMDYFKEKGYEVKRNKNRKESGHPDFIIIKNENKSYIEEKLNGCGLTNEQEDYIIKLIDNGNLVLLARTNLKKMIISIYQLNKLLEMKFLFKIEIPKDIVKKTFFKCYYCKKELTYNNKDRNFPNRHRLECKFIKKLPKSKDMIKDIKKELKQ